MTLGKLTLDGRTVEAPVGLPVIETAKRALIANRHSAITKAWRSRAPAACASSRSRSSPEAEAQAYTIAEHEPDNEVGLIRVKQHNGLDGLLRDRAYAVFCLS
jgi:hypothetical protein